MIQLYRERPRPGDAHLAALLDGLQTGESREGGQGLLRSAVVRYHEAMLTEEKDRKAELILLANALVGLHEQVRLQPYIARALDAPVRCVRDSIGVPGRLLPEALRSVIREQAEKVQTLWRLLATKEMMTMRLPDELLDLGHDLPAPPGLPLHCAELATIEDRELLDLLSEYSAHDQTTHRLRRRGLGVAARAHGLHPRAVPLTAVLLAAPRAALQPRAARRDRRLAGADAHPRRALAPRSGLRRRPRVRYAAVRAGWARCFISSSASPSAQGRAARRSESRARRPSAP